MGMSSKFKGSNRGRREREGEVERDVSGAGLARGWTDTADLCMPDVSVVLRMCVCVFRCTATSVTLTPSGVSSSHSVTSAELPA